MKKLLLTLVIFTCCVQAGLAQQTRLDSLLRKNTAYQKEDSARLLLLIDLMNEYKRLKLKPQRFQYAEAATALGEKIKVLTPLPAIYNRLGLYYEGISEFEKSIINYNRAIELCRLFGNRSGLADYTLNLGTVYQILGDYSKALSHFQAAAAYYNEVDNYDDLASCYINIAGLYKDYSGQRVKALEYLIKAADICERIGEGGKRGLAVAYSAMGTIYFTSSDAELIALKTNPKEKYAISRQYFNKVISIGEETKDLTLKADAFEQLGRMEENLLNYDSALLLYKQSYDVYQQLDYYNNYGTQQLLNEGRIYKSKGDYTNSLQYLHQALAGGKKMGVPDMQSDALLGISEVHEKLNHFDSAYQYYKQYFVMRDSIFSNEKQKEFTRKQLQFDFAVKEREYKLNQQIAENKIRQQEVFALQQQRELSLRNKQLELTMREKEIEKLNYLQKQSELEAEQKLKTAQLRQKDLAARLETSKRDQKIGEQQLQLREDKNLTTFLIILLFVFSGAAFVVYSAKQRASKLNKVIFAQKEKLEEMGRVKDKVLSIVSHDMRAPVSNLIAFSSLLDGGASIEPERMSLYMQQIKNTLDHTASLMENLLNWAASQMQGFTPVIERVDITPLVQHTLKGVQETLFKKKIAVDNQLPEGICVQGDRNMIELIIRNLVSNAVKFSNHQGKLELAIDQQHSRVVLSIKDTGVGMDETKVFQINKTVIHAVETTRGTDKEKGTGLGLMLSKHFVVMMGGSITVKSQPGMGSVFHIALPSA